MKTPIRTNGVNIALAISLILTVALGCNGLRRNRTTQTNPPFQTFKELKTTGTITSANTGGTCMKNINGQSVRTPQVGFSYTVDGKSYESVGCTYNPQTTVGAKINVCYNSSSPTSAKPCSE